MKKNLVFTLALFTIAVISVWGVVDNASLTMLASIAVNQLFESRSWFIMLSASVILIFCLYLMFSRYGKIKLGADDDEPEYTTVQWLSMLFSAGMGVGLLFWAVAEPLSHYMSAKRFYNAKAEAGVEALFITNFHWGFHAWAIYGIVGLIIAYFSFRKGRKVLLSAPMKHVYGKNKYTKLIGMVFDYCAIVAIAIGLAGSIAMGVFQITSGMQEIVDISSFKEVAPYLVFGLLVACYIAPLGADLGNGMAKMSSAAMAIAIFLMVFILFFGPTSYLMSTVIDSLGAYLQGVLAQGFKTYSFYESSVTGWFKGWTLTYFVWWLAWSPFVGVFIARISKGRTIKEFLIGVIFVPALFSVFWFGTFGGMGAYDVQFNDNTSLLELTKTNPEAMTFAMLNGLPLSKITNLLIIVATFLFIITSVVSAAYVLGMFSSDGDLNPSKKIKVTWGLGLGGIGLVMILSGNVDNVKTLIALGAMPFAFIVMMLLVTFVKSLMSEEV